ncbi:MAG: 16S rRNA (guanine(527)-N(7))-methyltransferase RsmG [candidate division WOR-3 bacterium]|nr:16S rRNA (guanine(527)-N(7))-methyltransferase RsmG [candidate division WOR-3 bacterium]
MRSKDKNSQSENIEREVDELRTGLVQLGIDFDADVIARFTDYVRILYSYHGKLHLLSHRDYERISRRHFLPSLAALQYVRNHRRVCDVGAGAGFPSIPLKALLPAIDLVIFESVAKKADFLRFLVDGIRLEGVEIRNERAEEYSGEGFDLMLFRAVGKVAKLLRLVDKLLVPGGEAIFYKSQHVNTELRQAETVMKKKGYTAKVITVSTPVEGLPLALVILNKPC